MEIGIYSYIYRVPNQVLLGRGLHKNPLHLVDVVAEEHIDFLSLEDNNSVTRNLPTGSRVKLSPRKVTLSENCVLPGGNIQEMGEVGIAMEPYM